MPDLNNASKISATRDPNIVTNPIFVELTDGTDPLGTVGNPMFVDITDATIAVTQSGTWNIDTVTTLTGITNDVNISDGGNSITVDAVDLDIRNLAHATDSVSIGDGTDTLGINTDGSINVNIVTAALSDEQHDYSEDVIASDSTANHDYAVQNTVFLLTGIHCSASGDAKFEIQVGDVLSLVTKDVVFLTGKEGDSQYVPFEPAIEIPVGTNGTVRIIKTNREGQAMSLYTRISGRDIT